jgi:riboflavin-specific deaminase-like protein
MSFHRLQPEPEALSAIEVAAAVDLNADPPADRPYLALNMVATSDGKVTIDGRSGPIGNEDDRELFLELRTRADAIMVGAGTARTEGYGRMVRKPERRERRRDAGFEEDPLAVLVSARLVLPPDMPLLQDPDSRVVVLTASQAEVEDARARVEYVRAEPAGPDAEAEVPAAIELRPLLRRLRAEHGVRSILCEGGPTLNSTLFREGLVDELFLSLAPKLVSGEAPSIVSGPELEEPLEFELVWVLESEDHLFLRYRAAR